MKITIYELLGLIKDGKAPEKIIYNSVPLIYDEDARDYFYYCNKFLFEYLFTNLGEFLNDYVEIIDDSKKIKKITVREKTLEFPEGEWTARFIDRSFAIKINEIIDRVNNLE